MAASESRTPAAEFEVAVSGLLSTYVPSASADSTSSRASVVYPDDVFDKIAKYLIQAGKQQWSLRPRTYIVLRLINRLDNMDAFILDGLFDIAFPYTYNRLPASLSAGTRSLFLEKQIAVLSKAGDLEMEHGRHRHFSSTADTNFVVVKQLGSGYFGVVDHVRSKLSLEEYARKRTLRARTFSKDKKALKIFENELSNLKRLSHRHLVKYVGSYTDPRYVGLLMSPVAECDLRVFLTQAPFPHNLISCLRSFLGCLCAAVSYLHSQKCRHKDLKPGNILVQGDVVLISDFGTSRNWSDRSKGTTTGESGPFTPGYAAPEVVAWEARNESSDIWSLGCVYLDIVTVLKGESLKSKDKFFGENGNGGKNPRVNPQALDLWLSKLKSTGDADDQPIVWIQQMLQPGPKDRISSVHLLDDVLGYADQHIYYGHCCADHDDEVSSCKSSEFADDDSVGIGAEESTNATSVFSEGEGGAKTLVGTPELTDGGDHSSLTQTFSSESLDVPQRHQNLSTTTTLVTNTRQPRDAPAATYGESIERTISQPEIPVLQSRNPFRPGYRPPPQPVSVLPQPSIVETPTQTQTTPNIYPTTPSDDTHVDATQNEIQTSITSEPPPSDSETAVSKSIVKETSTQLERSRHQDSAAGSLNQMRTLSSLLDAAAYGDVPGLYEYSSGGSILHEGSLGKSVFHAAAVHDQKTVMQLLLDMGCPVFPSDVATFILPAVDSDDIMLKSDSLAHRLVSDQLKSVRLQILQKENTSESSRKVSDSDMRATPGRGYYEACERLRQERTYLFKTFEIIRNDFPTVRHPSAIGPWDPAGFHWNLTFSFNPAILTEAIKRGNYNEIFNCLNGGYQLELRDTDGQTSLDVAIEYGLVSVIELLIAYGANPGLKDPHGDDAYAKTQERFFGAERSQVIELLDGAKNEWHMLSQRRPQLPRTVYSRWADFLATHDTYRGADSVLDVYPGQVFELEDTSKHRVGKKWPSFFGSHDTPKRMPAQRLKLRDLLAKRKQDD